MRVVKRVGDKVCANCIRYLLMQVGIPSYLSEPAGARADERYAVWVYFDSQFDAACKTLADPPHLNSCPMDVDDFVAEREVAA